ncbi:MAG: glutathione S-transferase [Gammaproteobacteria bacterium]|nr:glutathione S-transferase [Gammaproteobacteria bacterium]
MKLFWAPQTRAQRAIWMLEEAGIDYEMERIDIAGPDRADSAEFRAASPMGKVPAIIDGDVCMSESAAICIYVADRYSGGALAPAFDDAQRGKYLYWTMYTPAVIEPAMSEKFNKVETNRYRNGWGDFDLMIETWDRELDNRDWILGDHFTAADVMLGTSAIFLRLFEMLPETRNLSDYADRCLARPANQRALEKGAG